MRSVLIIALLASPALADPESISSSTPAPSTVDIGFRVGGYGFRREGDPRPGEGWTECRMNGVGVFGDKVLRGPLYVELGLDAYTSSDFVMGSPSSDLPIDRMSVLVSSAIGARTFLTPWLRGYVQLGGGVELTRASIPYGDGMSIRSNQALPEGFIGVGGDIRVGKGTYVGAAFRMLVMGNFDYAEQHLSMPNQWVTPPPSSEVFAASPDFAAQGQFYVRHDL